MTDIDKIAAYSLTERDTYIREVIYKGCPHPKDRKRCGKYELCDSKKIVGRIWYEYTQAN